MTSSPPLDAAGYAAAPSPVTTFIARGAIEHVDTGAGPVFLALHGGMGGYDQSWLLARALLPDLGAYRVLALSRPGYLGTALAVGDTPERQADAYAALLDALAIERAWVAAVSAGGPSALHFALRHPRRCAGLILVSTATGRLPVDPRIARRMRAMGVLARIPGVPGLLRRKAERDPRAAAARAIPDAQIAERTLADPQAGPLLRALQRGVLERLAARLPGTRHDTRQLRTLPDIPFERLEVPAFLVHGTADRVVPFTHAAAVAERAPRATLLKLHGGEHVALFTHLHDIRAALAQFLAAGRAD